MVLSRYYGAVLMEIPASCVARLAQAGLEQELRDELKPLWLMDTLTHSLAGYPTKGFEEFISGLVEGTSDESRPASEIESEMEFIVGRYKEVASSGVDIPAVR